METADALLGLGGMRRIVWVGWGLSGIVIAFLLLDATMKILALPVVLQAGDAIGFPGVSMARGLGLLLLACTLLYLVPRTSVLGAILVTAYLGGAVATHVRLGNPLFSHVLFGVYVGIFLCVGLALRHPRLLGIVPFLRGD
jgi:hypothetical protein